MQKLTGLQRLEEIIYESKPYFYLGLGIYALTSPEPNPWILACALIALFGGTMILRLRLKNRKDTSLERFVYEVQPFFYLAFAIYALVYLRQSKLAAGCALILLFCSTMILRWRYKHRG